MDHTALPAVGRRVDLDAEIERLAGALDGAHEARRAEIYDEMVLCAIPLADSIAHRYAGRGIDTDDLVQVARLAAVKAVRGYRPGAGPGFSAYAIPTIHGEVKRYFRDTGWMVRPPRRLQELRVQIRDTEERERHVRMREPTMAELAESLGCGRDEVEEALTCSSAYRAVSLDAPSQSGHRLAEDLVGSSCPATRIAVRDALDRLIAGLEERQRTVVQLRFEEELTQSEIAARIGVSQMQVSRILTGIMTSLREALRDENPLTQ